MNLKEFCTKNGYELATAIPENIDVTNEKIFYKVPGMKYYINISGQLLSIIYGKFISGTDTKYGYKRIKYDNGKPISIHQIMGLCFIKGYDRSDKTKCINHIDGNKKNNHIDNLEWVTYKENTNHAWKIGLCKVSENNVFKTNHPKHKPWLGKRGFNNPNSKTVLGFKNGKQVFEFGSCAEAERHFNKSSSKISQTALGKRKTAYGYVWKYKT